MVALLLLLDKTEPYCSKMLSEVISEPYLLAALTKYPTVSSTVSSTSSEDVEEMIGIMGLKAQETIPHEVRVDANTPLNNNTDIVLFFLIKPHLSYLGLDRSFKVFLRLSMPNFIWASSSFDNLLSKAIWAWMSLALFSLE